VCGRRVEPLRPPTPPFRLPSVGGLTSSADRHPSTPATVRPNSPAREVSRVPDEDPYTLGKSPPFHIRLVGD
jgi:hypothetical protein